MTIFSAKMGGFRPFTAYIDHTVGPVGRLASSIYKDGMATGTGTYQAVTAHRPMSHWDRLGVLDKTMTAITHAAGAVAQGAIWAPAGLLMGAVGCILGALGRADLAQDVLTEWYMPAYAVLGTLEVAANVVGVCLFGAWIGSLLKA